MISTLGETLPYAVAIAISPIPIIATILLLMSKSPRRLGLSFLSGWSIGVIVAVLAFSFLAELLPDRDQQEGPQPVLGLVRLLLGLALLGFAVRRWLSRPKTGEIAGLPRWMSKIDGMKPVGAAGLAFLLASVNPKNLVLNVAAASVIGNDLTDYATFIGAAAIFAVIATIGIAAPVLAYLTAPGRARIALDKIRGWLTTNNSVIMSVMMIILGAQLIGKSLSSF